MDPQIAKTLAEILAEIKKMRRQMLWSRILGTLIVLIPLGFFVWLFPKILNNFIGTYLPEGAQTQTIQDFLRQILPQK